LHIIFSTAARKYGISIYWNDEILEVTQYDCKTKHYFCGKELLKFDTIKTKLYTILVIDVEDCCCADVYSDAEIKVLFQEHSSVPHKHKKGGQSAARFARIRDSEITLWFKRINEYLKPLNDDIYLGINHVYERRFIKTLSTYNKEKIKEIRSSEYCNLTGIYQYINKLELIKNG